MDADKIASVTRRGMMAMGGAALALPAVAAPAQILEKRRMAFTPTFIDLVRNYTTTTGTGAFVLGAAVSGYSSFTDTVPPGTSFYYSATGIDKPAEFEVGRGTMQSDGTIAREPAGGEATNFTSGYKAVALVAAAEWFANTQAAAAAAPASMASREAVAALADKTKPVFLIERGREGMFIFDSADASAAVGADPMQGVYVAPESDRSGASGAWARTPSQRSVLDAGSFGLVSDGATDNHAKLASALSLARSLGHSTVAIPAGSYLLSESLAIPDGVTLEGAGRDTVLVAGNASGSDATVIRVTDGSHFAIRNMKLKPAGGATLRSGILLTNCKHASIENVVVDEVTDNNAVILFDCDSCVIDNLYFDGGAGQRGNAVYASGCRGCKVSNSTATNCFAGFGWSGYDIDSDINPAKAPRASRESYGNSTANCTVRNCTTQAFNANSSSNNVFSNCHAEDYAGTSTHKAFQAKDPGTGPEAGKGTRGNMFIGCTVNNYPGGFGGQLGADTQIVGCSGKDISNRFIELNGVTAPIVDCCSVDGFAVGIWVGGGTVLGKFTNITLETSTAAAIGIQCAPDGNNGSNNFDNVTTTSSLAKFIDVAQACTNNRFGPGCRSNSQPISDASNSSTWPMIFRTDLLDLTVGGSLQYGPYVRRQIQVARATFVVTTTITGSPQVSAGVLGSNTAYTAATAVSGSAGTVVNLPVANATSANANILQGRVAAAGTAGKGFLQFEGLPLL